MNVLLVEDNEISRELALFFLTDLGFNPEIAVNGKEAAEKVISGNFDLVFMDCQMPIMDGFESTMLIRSSQDIKQPKIVAMTANVFEEEKDKCFAAGMDAHISKPISKARINETIVAIFSKGESEFSI